MFGFDLTRDEWGLTLGLTYFVLRLTYLIASILWRFWIDASITFSFTSGYWFFGTMIAGAVVGVSLVSIATEGALRNARPMGYGIGGVSGAILALSLDVIITIRLFNLSYWLASFRVPDYRERLLSNDSAVRLLAAERLASLGNRSHVALPELYATMQDESADVRAASALAVYSANSSPPPPGEPIPSLRGIGRDSTSEDRETPAAARRALNDSDFRVRSTAAAILVQFHATPASDVLPALIEGLTKGDDKTANLAAWALGELGPEAVPAIPTFHEVMVQRYPPVVGVTAALGKIGPLAVPTLIEILERGSLNSRWEAADVLGTMGEPGRAALPVLRRLERDSTVDYASKVAVKKAIRRLGGDRK